MKIAKGDWKWIESMTVGEQVNIEIKQIKKTKDGKRNYLHAINEDDGTFFMANISPQQAVDLEGIKYAVMKCSGQSDRDGKTFFYYDFTVADGSEDEVDGSVYGDVYSTPSYPAGDGVDEEFTYSPVKLEEDVLEILKNMNWMDYDSNISWYVDVKEYLLKAMMVLYKRKIERIIKD